jgi:uncharacterized protein YbbK (DUF523 family)
MRYNILIFILYSPSCFSTDVYNQSDLGFLSPSMGIKFYNVVDEKYQIPSGESVTLILKSYEGAVVFSKTSTINDLI